MKIIFLGSSQFAVPSLKAIINSGHELLCVITQPDRKKGRGLRIESTDVKRKAREAGFPVFQPSDINSPSSVKELKKYSADLFVVIAYGQILSAEVLAIPSLFALNLHASLLPGYRGAAPINWALIRGENFTGVTVMKLVRKMDAGPIIEQNKVGIEESDDALTLEEKLAVAGEEALLGTLKKIEEKGYKLTEQDEKKATFAPKLKKSDGLIDWGIPAKEVADLVRGCAGWPGAFTVYHGKQLKIIKAVAVKDESGQGLVNGGVISVPAKGILVKCSEGALLIERLQPEGKRVMSSAEFIAGHKLKPGEILGKK